MKRTQKRGRRGVTKDHELEREAQLGRLARLLAQLPAELLWGYESCLDDTLTESRDLAIPRVSVLSDQAVGRNSQTDRDACLGRTLQKLGIMSCQYLAGAEDLARSELHERGVAVA